MYNSCNSVHRFWDQGRGMEPTTRFNWNDANRQVALKWGMILWKISVWLRMNLLQICFEKTWTKGVQLSWRCFWVTTTYRQVLNHYLGSEDLKTGRYIRWKLSIGYVRIIMWNSKTWSSLRSVVTTSLLWPQWKWVLSLAFPLLSALVVNARPVQQLSLPARSRLAQWASTRTTSTTAYRVSTKVRRREMYTVSDRSNTFLRVTVTLRIPPRKVRVPVLF